MTSLSPDIQSADPGLGVRPPLDLPDEVLAAAEELLADLVEKAGPDTPDFDQWRVTAAELDVSADTGGKAAWLITVMDAQRLLVGFTIHFDVAPVGAPS